MIVRERKPGRLNVRLSQPEEKMLQWMTRRLHLERSTVVRRLIRTLYRDLREGRPLSDVLLPRRRPKPWETGYPTGAQDQGETGAEPEQP